MIILIPILSFITGYTIMWFISRNKCEHNYKLEQTFDCRSGNINYIRKAYECTKCHKVKNVQLGY